MRKIYRAHPSPPLQRATHHLARVKRNFGMKVRLCMCAVLSVSSLTSVCSAQQNTGDTANVKASWYQSGHTTACGDRFNPDDPTIAAHKELECGTVLKVTNHMNGRYLRMVVRDKGPYIPGRSLDVSRAAARQLGFLEQGVADVTVEVLTTP